MCFVFTCGEHTFRKQVEGYESITCQCHNCGNYAGHVIKSNPWFTFCFIVRLFPWFLFLIYKRVASAPFVKELPARIDQQANFPFPTTSSPSSRSPSRATRTSSVTSATSPSP